jgi:hypothetical protein
MNKLSCLGITIFLAVIFSFINTPQTFSFGPTIAQNGEWIAISSFQIVQGKIDNKSERICLPKITFSSEVDEKALKKLLKKGIQSQKAIFHLYHDGLGRPKKRGGMFFASDIYLKEMKMTYTGYLRKLGYSVKISKTPPFEDQELMRNVLYSRHISKKIEEQKKQDKKKKKEKKEPKVKKSNMRVRTIWDVLPKGVIPPSIRAKNQEILRRIKNLKKRPYKKEIVEVDPARWAAGRFGLIQENGYISGSNVEGQKPELRITPPKEKNWLTPELIKELQNQPCEFILQRDKNGREIIENGKYLLVDLYLKKQKLSWEEWLSKHNLTFVDLPQKPHFATTTVKLEVDLAYGKWNRLIAPALCQITFNANSKFAQGKEVIRMNPPARRPKKFKKFLKPFNKATSGKDVRASLLICKDGEPYTELGQKRAKRIYFTEFKEILDIVIIKVFKGQIK